MMKWLEDIAQYLGINASTAVFAFCGSLLAALRHRQCTWQENVVTFLTGFVFALVAPSFIVKWFSLSPDPAYFGGLGFVFGYFGMSIMDEWMNLIRDPEWRKALISRLKRGKE